jgi:hypothetical protein
MKIKPFWLEISGFDNRFDDVDNLEHFLYFPERLDWCEYRQRGPTDEPVFTIQAQGGQTVKEFLIKNDMFPNWINPESKALEDFYERTIEGFD